MGSYFCVDAKLWKQFNVAGNRLVASLGIDNLLDNKYDGEFIYNAPGRYIELNVNYHFDW